MIRGHRPNGYFQRGIANDKIEVGETRQCVHCGHTWKYVPGSGSTRGFCLKCNGLMCGRQECQAEQRQLMASFPDRTWSCMPLNDWNERMREQYAKDPRWEVLPSGIVVSRA